MEKSAAQQFIEDIQSAFFSNDPVYAASSQSWVKFLKDLEVALTDIRDRTEDEEREDQEKTNQQEDVERMRVMVEQVLERFGGAVSLRVVDMSHLEIVSNKDNGFTYYVSVAELLRIVRDGLPDDEDALEKTNQIAPTLSSVITLNDQDFPLPFESIGDREL
jgi:hypothetical protein